MKCEYCDTPREKGRTSCHKCGGPLPKGSHDPEIIVRSPTMTVDYSGPYSAMGRSQYYTRMSSTSTPIYD